MEDLFSIGDIAALATAMGVAIYVLGLVGLAIPIRTRFTGDMATAWYAVSLLPRTVVAGQGLRIWVQWPLLFTAIVLVQRWLLATPWSLVNVLITTVLLGPLGGIVALHDQDPALRPRTRRLLSLLGMSDLVLMGIAGATSTTELLETMPFLALTFFAGFLVGLPWAF